LHNSCKIDTLPIEQQQKITIMTKTDEAALTRALSVLREVNARLTMGVDKNAFEKEFRGKQVSPGVSVQQFVRQLRLGHDLEETETTMMLKSVDLELSLELSVDDISFLSWIKTKHGSQQPKFVNLLYRACAVQFAQQQLDDDARARIYRKETDRLQPNFDVHFRQHAKIRCNS
jgi:hypothetical protein